MFELEIEKREEIEKEKEDRNPIGNPNQVQQPWPNPSPQAQPTLTLTQSAARFLLPTSHPPPLGPPSRTARQPSKPLLPRPARARPFCCVLNSAAAPRARTPAPAAARTVSPASLPVSLSSRARWQDLPLPPPKIVAGLPAPPAPCPAAPWVIPDLCGPTNQPPSARPAY